MKLLRHVLILLAGLSSVACTLNSVRLLPAGSAPSAKRAVIVYGVQVVGAWDYAGYQVQVAEYDIEKQNITGNCFRFNRAEAVVSSVPGAVNYFAFDVPAGHYVYSPFNGARMDGDSFAFEAPAGQSVYLGSFRFEKNKMVSLARNFEPVMDEVNRALPGLQGQVSLAKATTVKRPFPFLCAP
ncbi:hypothetical protein [Massilia sp. 9I]|uniref:hypothetical protein n=1 Tax=Massilia sp. 9I TaxID=2653152 RepID=UPI0012F0DEC9|nr:hypothetical protein [Massilia sp. 9I]VXB80787.1 conserved exported hypothetical protein [Massilia sp. 9I]